jgi:hypothetical protein
MYSSHDDHFRREKISVSARAVPPPRTWDGVGWQPDQAALKPRRIRRKQSYRSRIGIALQLHSPMPPFPNHLPLLVVDGGGGGLSICEAVGARDWRIE